MADEAELRMNLAAIKRVDPYAKDIVDSSAHVAFYTFNSDENEWEKTDVEGAFFVYSRTAEPLNSLFVNNRLNTNSLVEPITSRIELQSQPPFLLYRNERKRIRGIWFYNPAECDRIRELVARLVLECEQRTAATSNDNSMTSRPTAGSSAAANNAASNNGVPANYNIFTMLSKAQEDFNNSITSSGSNNKSSGSNNNNNVSTSVNSTPVQNNRHQQQQAPASVPHLSMMQPPPPLSTSVDGTTSQSVMNFFAAAKPANAKEVPYFQRLLSNPVPVEQIEKQQRSSSPPLSSAQLAQNSPKQTENGNFNNNGFMRIHSPHTSGQAFGGGSNQPAVPELGTSPLATFLNSNTNLVRAGGGLINPTNATDVSELESRHKKPGKQLHQLLKKELSPPQQQSPLQQQAAQQQQQQQQTPTPGKPALMPPTMFISSNNSPASIPQQSQAANKPIDTAQPQQLPLSTSAINNNNSSSGGGSTAKLEPLTQSQMLQALIFMIESDPDFMRKLHEAYLKSFTQMAVKRN